MPRNKKGAFGKKVARPHDAALTAYSSRKPRFRRDDGDVVFTSETPPATIMQQLARNTTIKTSHWDQVTKLRSRPVIFVSGGVIDPLEKLQEIDAGKPSESAPGPSTRPADSADPTDSANPVDHVGPADSTHSSASSIHVQHPQSNVNGALDGPVSASSNNEFAISSGVDKEIADALHESPDPDSDSSEEIILFKGRGPALASRVPESKHVTKNPQVAADEDHVGYDANDVVGTASANNLDALLDSSNDEGGSDAAIKDYMENISGDSMQSNTLKLAIGRSELGGSGSEMVIEEQQSGGENGSDGKSDVDEQWQLCADIDDQHLARLLAKQEELGFDANELLLLDGDSTKSLATRQERHISKAARKQNRKRQQPSIMEYFTKEARKHSSYPSAEAVAEAFEHLDMVGWGGELDFEVSDSDMEARLKTAWQSDRLRKKERKRAREELRSQGLLGKNVDPSDPRTKYLDGMSLDDIKTEFRTFLQNQTNSLSFPPMDAHARKIVHELAHRFNITSKSAGSGDQRRPTLARKKATLRYDDNFFESVFARVRRRYFPRLDGKPSRPIQDTVRRGASNGAATVRNGEVVGGSAPEIGESNKGRTILEKMGWSSGMALGAINNKGMTVPIEHVVKRSKAGLG